MLFASFSTFKVVAFLTMAFSSIYISQEEFNLFHSIDRKLYTLLVSDLWRDPLESMQIIALWLWLERAGFYNVVKRILSLPHVLINELADEAVTCLNCINNPQFLFSPETSEIPLTNSFMKKEISLSFFHENRLIAIRGVAKVAREVCVRALTDIMEQAIRLNTAKNMAESQMMVHGFAHMGIGADTAVVGQGRNHGTNEVPADDRTMFVTFSKGYPVAEWEVRDFFSRIFGDCIESFYMQEVKPPEDQALFARIVFSSPTFIELILDGVVKAKFTINGKHVWMRKFVPKHPRTSPPPSPTQDPPAAV
ncbi:hypothetical protein RJ639_026758 [Escallonia herrerae]|uniref:Uncharacterized protein n=1 Tax=Escallonia herrerae TaxID=1293975 RepID=A0AA88X5M1_9ASTE|nr:hypothetical protein RJ639_026758 [Escallonia herrerae]